MNNIAPAFIKAKRAFGPALKEKNNPAFRSKYADLGACIDAVEDALLANGIAFIQETFDDSTGVTVETVFLHESGEVMRCGKLHVPASKQDPQGYGSALTYARRYSLMSACGIAPEDDDGNAASKSKPQQRGEIIPKSFRSGATMGVFETLAPDRQNIVADAAAYVIERFEANDVVAAYDEANRFHDDERVALAGKLPSHVRSGLKKYGVQITSSQLNQEMATA